MQVQEVRTELVNGEYWFAATDVCKILGLENNRQALVSLDSDEKGVINTDTPGGRQDLNFVNESGLYNLIFQSRKPEAKRFRKWVTSVLLPTLRRTGSYSLKNNTQSQLFTCLSPEEQLQYAKTIERDGFKWIKAADIAKALGFDNPLILIRCKKLSLDGKAQKIKFGKIEYWYVRQDAVPDISKPTLAMLMKGGAAC